jgi:serine/arginine repetitive matrix protein 2
MTERTFRDPSPARSSPVDRDAPPVPKLPRNVQNVQAQSAGGVHRRASSLEPAYRGGSPVARGSGRGVSLDRGVSGTPDRGHAPTSSLSQVPEDDQYGNPINFSRPISPMPTNNSPRAAAPARGGHSGWFGGPVVNPNATFRGTKSRPQTSDGYTGSDAYATQQAIRNVADRPVSSNRGSLAHGSEGARLASGSLRAKQNPHVAQSRQSQASLSAHHDAPRTVDPNSPFAVYDPSTRTFIHKQDAMAMHRAISDAEEPPPRYEQHHREASQQRQPQRQSTQPQAPRQPVEQSYEPEYAPVPFVQHEPASNRALEPLESHPKLARRSSEDFADEDVRPVANANSGRKLESTPAHEETQSPKFAPNQSSPYPRIDTTVASKTSAPSTPSQAKNREERGHSMSPPRNAHFAAVSLELPNDIKHQPPPRSVSPAKSALKASPSVSRRGNSPVANDGRFVSRGPASEVSDAMSEDGIKKKKKAVRVSFDEDPVIAGTSAYADAQSAEQGLGASMWSNADQEEEDDFMKPRPVLPSFGSVRDKERRAREGDAPEKVTETVSSSLSNSAISASEPPIEISSDALVGGILAQEYASKTATKSGPQDPLPPEVTTVEGSGYISDSDQSEASGYQLPMHTHNEAPTQFAPEPEPKTLTAPVERREEPTEVPFIAVQPATPSLVERSEPKFQRPLVPGGWDDDEVEPETVTKPVGTTTKPVEIAAKPIDTSTKPAEEEPRNSTAISFANMEALRSQYPREESSDDDSSIYSDAYEDLSEAEDGGFASIDAVVESPIASPSGLLASKFADTTPKDLPKSALRYEHKEETNRGQAAGSSNDWTASQQHWSEVNAARKQEVVPEIKKPKPTERTVRTKVQPSEPAPISARKADVEPVAKTPKPAAQPRKSALKKTAVTPAPIEGAPPPMRKSMRDGPVVSSAASNEPRMKKSMRDTAGMGAISSPEPQMRKSMRGGNESTRQPAGLAASRFSSPPVDAKPPRGALQKRHIPAAVAAKNASAPRPQSVASSAPRKTMTPAPTYDSDSDASQSSFQRSRPRASRKEAGRYTMRGSMRGAGPAPTMRATPAPTMRPTSPVQAISPPPTIRKSMRPSSPTAESPANAGIKSSRFSIRSLSPAGRFRPKSTIEAPPPLPTQSPKRTSMFGGKSSKPKASAPAGKPSYKSRFADSSDEDDDRPRGFQSRFADSDDDDEVDLAPVRGIPKRPGEEDGDSTDLEDELSDAEASSKAVEAGKGPATNGVTNGQGSNFTTGSLRSGKHAPLPDMEAGKKAKSKRGFFGLGKKKAPASYLEPDASLDNGNVADIPMPPQHRRDHSRPLTPIGEDKDVEPVESAPRSPKLQRRSAPQRSTSDSWPLPQPPTIGEDARPQSSDGIMNRRTSLRPTLNKRYSSTASQARTMTDPTSGKEVVIGRTGKKKKFQGLRRVFGLND